MKKFISAALTVFNVCLFFSSFSQAEASKWYFGSNAGLDFSTTPPTSVSNGQSVSYEGTSSAADVNGNLLFYTNGVTIWNQQHQMMANGTGLMGNTSSSQSALVVKQPGNSHIYFVFTVDFQGGPNGLCYSTVDMNLAAGMGSVTVKNTTLYTPTTEKLAAVRHCNGVDMWLVSHDYNSNTFRSFLVSASGVGTPVLSSLGIAVTNTLDALGCMKISPNGRKLGLAVLGQFDYASLFDFDPSTGSVSNYLNLGYNGSPYGCEFSPDGTKFYVSHFINSEVRQYDLCAGNNAAIISSMYSIATSQLVPLGALQLGPDGKIYLARSGQQSLGVINAPDLNGSACNYVDNGLLLASGSCSLGLPNFPASYLKLLPAPFTASLSCLTASLFSPPALPVLYNGCSATSYTYNSATWYFGDPASGAANSSTLANPTHVYSTSGTYVAKLVFSSSCGIDTLRKIITTGSVPSLSVTGRQLICSGETSTLTGSGATTYSWSVTNTTPTIAVSPTVTSSYTLTGTIGSCSSTKIVTVSVSKCTALNEWWMDNKALNIYPNPASSDLYLQTESAIHLVIYNNLGKEVWKSSLESGEHRIDLQNFSAGLYTLRYSDQNHSQTLKFMKTE